jgi:hypothetical protein
MSPPTAASPASRNRQPGSLSLQSGNLRRRNLVRSFPRICDDNGIRRIQAHALRHTTASLLKALGVPAKNAQVIPGHARNPRGGGFTDLARGSHVARLPGDSYLPGFGFLTGLSRSWPSVELPGAWPDPVRYATYSPFDWGPSSTRA